MWNKELTPATIRSLSSCKVDTVDTADKVVSWTQLSSQWSISGNVYLAEQPLNSICQNQSSYDNTVLMLQPTSYDYIKLTCDPVGGRMPIIYDNKLVTSIQSDTKEVMRILGRLEDYNKCVTDKNDPNGSVKFWLGQYKDSENQWTNPYDSSKTFENFKAPQTLSKCVYVLGNGIFQEECSSHVACGVCNLVDKNEFGTSLIKMKGVCKDDLWSNKLYDVDYYIHGVKNGRPYFRFVSLC